MAERLISEAIEPIWEGADIRPGATGAPVLPRRFRWRERDYEVLAVLEAGKGLGPCRNGSSERYLRRHWYRLRVGGGVEMRLYFDRQPKGGARGGARAGAKVVAAEGATEDRARTDGAARTTKRVHRWWLYSILADPADEPHAEA